MTAASKLALPAHQNLCALVSVGSAASSRHSQGVAVVVVWVLCDPAHFTREQRCRFHKQANVLAALPKSAHHGAPAAMREIYDAEDID